MISTLSVFLLLFNCHVVLVVSFDEDEVGHYGECGSGKVNYPILPGNIGGTAGRAKRQTPQPIHILPYFVTANISAEVLDRLQANDGPVMNALNYFRMTLSVQPFGENIRAPQLGMCGPHATIPQDHGPTGRGVDADYLYYITAVNDDTCQGGSVVAYAGPCFVATTMNSRPYIGYVNFCPSAFDTFSEQFINNVAIHETIHALVFTPFLLERFPFHANILSELPVNGRNVSIVITPKVAQAVQDHYNCSTLNGSLLENEGGSSMGTHWETRVLFPEIMNARLYDDLANETVISQVTLGLFEDSGWYEVNYSAGLVNQDKFLWGANEGCGFVTANCSSNTSFPYVCTPCPTCIFQAQCSYDFQSVGFCQRAAFFDNCTVIIPDRFCTDTRPMRITPPTGLIADFGPDSICVASSDPNNRASTANCVRHRCVQIQGTNLIAFSLTFNRQTEWCYPGGTVNGGLLKCPPIKYSCARSTFDMLSPTDDLVPPPLCDPSCASCSAAHNPAFCLTCPTGRRLNGNAPTSCVSVDNPCNGSTYLNSGGSCSNCLPKCSLCNGIQNTDCLACEDTTLYREITNIRVFAGPCVTTCGSKFLPNEDVFGVRICVPNPRASGVFRISVGYWTVLLLFVLIVAAEISS